MGQETRRWAVLGLSLFLCSELASASVMPQMIMPIPWIIESAEYTGDVKGQIVRLEARYTIQVTQEGISEIPIVLPGATITAIKIEKKAGEAHIAPRNGAYVLVASKKGAYKLLVQFSQLLAQDSQFEGVSLSIPQATFSTMTLSVPHRDVELRPADQLYVERQRDPKQDGVKLTARLGSAERMDLRWRTKPVDPVKVEPVLYGEVHALASIEEQLARLTATINYRVAQGEVKELRIQLPALFNVLNVRGSAIEDWRVTETVAEAKTLVVILSSPLKDAAYQLTVEGEQTLEAKQERYSIPEIRLENVKQERGYLAISRSGSIEVVPEKIEGINRVDVKELPEDLLAVVGSTASFAFKYHQHPFQISLGLVHHEDHPVLNGIAERAELASIVSQQGELLTRAVYFIRANKKQFLEAGLPDGARLWSCLVNGRSVKPVKGTNEHLLIPLDASGESAESTMVELVYFEQHDALVRLGHLKLQGPTLDVPTTIANWSVYTPKAVKVLRVGGNLERGAAAVDYLEDESVMRVAQTAANEPLGVSTLISKSKEQARRSFRQLANGSGEIIDALELEGKDDDNGRGRPAKLAATLSPEMSGAREDLPGNKKREEDFEFGDKMVREFQEAGILPLKIRLPKSGMAYHFNRLMTTNEPLRIDATFVRVPVAWVAMFGCALVLIPAGAFAAARLRRS